jgi:hypothetical protein
MPVEDTFAIIKPDAFGQPWIEWVLEKNEEEEEPPVDDEDEGSARPPREPFKRVAKQRAPDMGVEILKRITAAGFEIVQRKTMKLTKFVRVWASVVCAERGVCGGGG